jgi:hypothetical protein
MKALRGVAAASILLAMPLRAQEFKGPLWGGSGGSSSYNLDCGSTGVMVGLYGKVGLWIDQIGVVCRKVNPDGTLGSTYTRGPVGGSGGSGDRADCPSGSVITVMGSWSGSFMDQVGVECYGWSPGSRRAGGGYTGAASLGKVGTIHLPGLTFNQKVNCPAEKVGKAVRGKSGGYIDSLQFVCDDYNK